ncbi:purine-nucleoside phosphorylase [Arcticibacterium luteifluviistationis]|uniref:Purine nucleoside phosphorylase n=1 Tax=Arcticibacterium luteifluviistationis TaxID=1784714 RepID=A0A2Z4GCM4_9BACT|nr:purine-nucleoside phosphorylase [Arcticibacterium luteifluviistationis]AWV99052.1 purine-nucleoside phosphorylase [Arcticibacterium luteifluviistationis]
MNLSQRINNTTNYLKEKTADFQPQIGIILGTGLGGLLKEIEVAYEIPYSDIPDFVEATVEFHSGKLVFGTLSGKKVVCMSGRFHYYEGYSMEQVTFPVRVMDSLGIKRLLISNACGGMNPDFKESDLMIIDDHISLFLPENPLVGECIKGDRFPDMSAPYDAEMIQIAQDIATENSFDRVQQGVYVSVSGPALESKAEYRLLRLVGADAVGMSTVPEALVAIQVGLKVFAISVITDMCIPETLKKAKIEDILNAAYAAEPQMTTIIKGVLERVK